MLFHYNKQGVISTGKMLLRLPVLASISGDTEKEKLKVPMMVTAYKKQSGKMKICPSTILRDSKAGVISLLWVNVFNKVIVDV